MGSGRTSLGHQTRVRGGQIVRRRGSPKCEVLLERRKGMWEVQLPSVFALTIEIIKMELRRHDVAALLNNECWSVWGKEKFNSEFRHVF